MTYGEIVGHRRVTEHELRDEMVRIGRLMWERGYVAATDGNLSARLANDRLLVTSSGRSKGFLSAHELLVLDMEGTPIGMHRRRGLRPSSEIRMHLEVYRQRPDVEAVIHAHPPLAIAFSIAGMSLARCVLPEVIVSLGGIPTTEYATPSTEEVPESIRSAIRDYDAMVLAHHGSLTVGKTLWEAYMRLEKVEHAAQITLAAHQLGQVETLSPGDVEKLVAMRREALEREGRDLCEGCTVCTLGKPHEDTVHVSLESSSPTDEQAFVRQIAGAVLRSIQQT
jgi:L-fuculose-phosphate aldolase